MKLTIGSFAFRWYRTLKWDYLGNGSDLITHGENAQKKSTYFFLKQNELCFFGFSSHIHLEKLFPPLAADQTQPGTEGWPVDCPAEREHHGFCRKENQPSMAAWLLGGSKLLPHVAFPGAYSHHSEHPSLEYSGSDRETTHPST